MLRCRHASFRGTPLRYIPTGLHDHPPVMRYTPVGVHIRSVTPPIGVILGLSGQIGYMVFASLTIIPELFIEMTLSGASFETRRVPFSHFQRIEICSGMPHWESHPRFRRSESLSLLSLAFRVIIITSQLRRSEPSSLFSFDVQSHHRFLDRHSELHHRFRRSEPSSLFSFGVQSHHRVFSSAFRAIIGFSDRHSESHPRFRRSKSLSLLSLTFRVIIITSQFDIQKSLSLLSLTFRVIIITSQLRRSEPSSLFSFGVQSHHCVFSSAFRAIIGFQIDIQSRILGFRRSEPSSLFSFGVQSHHRVFSSAFRAIISFQIDIQSRIPRFRRSESLSLLSLTFRVIIITSQLRRSEPSSLFSFGVQSHHRVFSSAFRAIIEPSSVFRSTFRVASSVSAFKVVITSQFYVQSHHHHFSVLAFRAIITFSFGVQSHHRVFSSAYRTIIGFQFDIQSRILRFGVQSHHHFLVSAFRAITVFSVRRSEPSPFPILTFRVSHFSLVVSSRVTTPDICIRWHCAFDSPDFGIHPYLPHPVTLCHYPSGPRVHILGGHKESTSLFGSCSRTLNTWRNFLEGGPTGRQGARMREKGKVAAEGGVQESRKLRTEERRVTGKSPGHGAEKRDSQTRPPLRCVASLIPPGRKFSLIPPGCLASGILLRRHSIRMSRIRNSSPPTFPPGCLASGILLRQHSLPDVSHPGILSGRRSTFSK
ncbi:hypothetical protein CK203_084072 [Vitis vinifera]|uniref:Uncharacterized protein n=1 Tax=Vitis vinifera TaxID=29760 RepID=A0A438FJW7_VITVI|nr:hypothetical protein CK203_084072 [Vitis vinifera]